MAVPKPDALTQNMPMEGYTQESVHRIIASRRPQLLSVYVHNGINRLTGATLDHHFTFITSSGPPPRIHGTSYVLHERKLRRHLP